MSIIGLKGKVMHFYFFPQDPETATKNPFVTEAGWRIIYSRFISEDISLSHKTNNGAFPENCSQTVPERPVY